MGYPKVIEKGSRAGRGGAHSHCYFQLPSRNLVLFENLFHLCIPSSSPLYQQLLVSYSFSTGDKLSGDKLLTASPPSIYMELLSLFMRISTSI